MCDNMVHCMTLYDARAGDSILGQQEVIVSAAITSAVAAAGEAAAAAGVKAVQADPAHAHTHGDIHARQIAAKQVVTITSGLCDLEGHCKLT